MCGAVGVLATNNHIRSVGSSIVVVFVACCFFAFSVSGEGVSEHESDCGVER